MATRSDIEWTERTWNPVVGCRRISTGCLKCYAEIMAARLAGMSRQRCDQHSRLRYYADVIGPRGKWNGQIALVTEALEDPLHWPDGMVFVNSMSDLFHENVPLDYIQRVFEVMNRCLRLIFQILTKRSKRLAELSGQLPWSKHIWMGVSVENEDYLFRIDDLRRTAARLKFLSLEPLLGPLANLNLDGIDWVIVGGESGPGARPMQSPWASDIRDQCQERRIPFFFKQWGKLASNPDQADPTAKENGGASKGGRQLEGRVWDQMPQLVCEKLA